MLTGRVTNSGVVLYSFPQLSSSPSASVAMFFWQQQLGALYPMSGHGRAVVSEGAAAWRRGTDDGRL